MTVCQRFEPAGLRFRKMSLFCDKTAKGGPVFAKALCKRAFGPANGHESTAHRVTIQWRPVARGRHRPGQWVAQSTMQHPKGRKPPEEVRIRNAMPRLPAQDPVL